MTNPDLLTHLEAALDLGVRAVAGVAPDQWQQPTACAGWDVGDVVAHLRDGTWWFAGALGGPAPGGADDVAPSAGLRQASDALLAAFRRPEALEQPVEIPLGAVPGVVALHLRATEALVHGWDVATATGQVLAVDDAVAEEALAFSQGAMAMIPPERSPFGPSQPVADDAPPMDRLVALLGRAPAHQLVRGAQLP